MGKGDRRKKNKKNKKQKHSSVKKRDGKIVQNLNDLKNLKNNSKSSIEGFSKNREKDPMYEIINEKLQYNESNPIHFLKWATKCKELPEQKVQYDNALEKNFPFAKLNNKELKNSKLPDFPLAWFKQKIKNNKEYSVNKDKIEKHSGIIVKNNLQTEVNKLIPFSFILQATINLISPYFSRDDDEFYLIQNPVLKENVFKVPMIRGSGWKGAIASAFKDLINEETDLKKENKLIQSYIRIFGTGSNEFRELLENIKRKLKNEGELDMQKVIKFFLFELGLKLTKKDIDSLKDKSEIDSWVEEKLIINFHDSSEDLPSYLTIHKGRVIFYPTYFDKLSLEIINPHSRKTRAGTNPIHYEVVPKDTNGILQIVYIPFDGVLTDENELKKQIGKDVEFLTDCIEKVSENGVGAKTKLGWGQFSLEEKRVICNRTEVNVPEGWNND